MRPVTSITSCARSALLTTITGVAPLLAHQCEIAFQARQVEVGIRRRHDEDDIDVGAPGAAAGSRLMPFGSVHWSAAERLRSWPGHPLQPGALPRSLRRPASPSAPSQYCASVLMCAPKALPLRGQPEDGFDAPLSHDLGSVRRRQWPRTPFASVHSIPVNRGSCISFLCRAAFDLPHFQVSGVAISEQSCSVALGQHYASPLWSTVKPMAASHSWRRGYVGQSPPRPDACLASANFRPLRCAR